MALTQITWADKTALNPQPSVARENKCTDVDLNEIKSVVNTNATKVGDLANLDTTATSNIVAAINEVKGQLKTTEVYSGDVRLYTSTAETSNLLTMTAVSGTVLMYYITYSQPLENWNNGALTEIGSMILNNNQVWLKTNQEQNYRIKINALYIE